MQFVPINPRPLNVVEDRLEVKRLAAVKAAKPVQPRTLPPLLTYAHVYSPQDQQEPQERRAPLQEDRRSYCRRVKHQPVLEELRSAIDRRKNPQRNTDQPEHIDIKV